MTRMEIINILSKIGEVIPEDKNISDDGYFYIFKSGEHTIEDIYNILEEDMDGKEEVKISYNYMKETKSLIITASFRRKGRK